MFSFKQRCYYSVWSTECSSKDELGLAQGVCLTATRLSEDQQDQHNAPHSRYTPQVSVSLILFRVNGFDQ
jgi:hypothetical protein